MEHKKRKNITIVSLVVCSLAVVFSSILIPKLLYNNNGLHMTSNDIMSFYLSIGVTDGEIEPLEDRSLSISRLFRLHKENSDELKEISDGGGEISFIGDGYYTCYYAKQEVAEEAKQNANRINILLERYYPRRGLTGYILKCRKQYLAKIDNVPKDERLYEKIINTKNIIVDYQIGDYYLVDIVRLYHGNNNFRPTTIDFVSYEQVNDKIIINYEGKQDNQKYYHHIPKSNIEHPKYYLMSLVDYFGIKINQQSASITTSDSFYYDSRFIEQDSTYYDDINKCVINKELTSTFDYYYSTNKYTRDIYNVVFNYYKLKKVFGL